MTREELIAAMKAVAAAPPSPVTVEGWGTVHIRPVSFAEAEALKAEEPRENDPNRGPRAVCRVLCDENGKLLLDPNNEEHVELVAKQPWEKIIRVLNGSGAQTEPASGN